MNSRYCYILHDETSIVSRECYVEKPNRTVEEEEEEKKRLLHQKKSK